jgi:hypothetical protein
MTITNWIIDIALLVIVFRQLREERLTARTILVPLALMTWAGFNYLRGVPTAGNDLTLIGLLTAVGVVFGLLGGLLTRVRSRSGNVFIRATAPAVALWVISMGFRMGLDIWSNYGSGVRQLATFSAAHQITSREAWVTALILMAFGEVVVRVGTIVVRGRLLVARDGGAGADRVGPVAEARY